MRSPDAQGGWRGPALLTVIVLSLIAILAYSGRLLGVGAHPSATAVPVSVAFPVAFLGGVLALLSPCSGAIVPAFFAYSFQTPGRLLRQTYVFFLGLSLIFVPLGFASSLLANTFAAHAGTFYAIAGTVLLLLGLTTLFDLDIFDRLAGALQRLTAPGQDAMRRTTSETTRVFVYGILFGFATSSCTAPLLGAMATLAIGTGGQSLLAMLLFLTFALGIAAPLFVLAALFERYGVAQRAWLRREVKLGRRRVPLTKLVTGLVLVVLGLVFLAFRGTVGLTSYYARFGADEAYARWTQALGQLFASVPPLLSFALALAGLVGLALLLRALARPRRAADVSPRPEVPPRK